MSQLELTPEGTHYGSVGILRGLRHESPRGIEGSGLRTELVQVACFVKMVS